jgi:hypothetical protein
VVNDQAFTDGLAGLPTVGILEVFGTMLAALRRREYEDVS